MTEKAKFGAGCFLGVEVDFKNADSDAAVRFRSAMHESMRSSAWRNARSAAGTLCVSKKLRTSSRDVGSQKAAVASTTFGSPPNTPRRPSKSDQRSLMVCQVVVRALGFASRIPSIVVLS